MSEFLSKDPTKALVEVKEKLYTRLVAARICAKRIEIVLEKHPSSYVNAEKDKTELDCIKDEIKFLENVLDMIERS